MAQIVEERGAVAVFRGLALPLAQLVGFVVALGMIVAVDAVVRGLFAVTLGPAGWLAKHIGLGGIVTSPLHKVEQKVVSGLDKLVAGLARHVAAAFNDLTVFVGQVFDVLLALSVAVAYLTYTVTRNLGLPKLKGQVGHLEKRQKQATAKLAQVSPRVGALERDLAHPGTGRLGGAIAARTRPLARELHGFEAGVLPRVKALEHAAGVAIPADIAGLRARTRATEGLFERLFRRVRRLDKVTGITVLTAAVAVALGRLGGSWIRCRNWRKIGKAGCRLPFNLLEDLLALTFGLLVVENIETLAEETAALLDLFESKIEAFVER